MKTRQLICVLIVYFLGFGLLIAQGIKIEVPEEVTEGETFKLAFTLTDGEIQDMEVTSFGEFDVIGGPNRSSSISIINGKRSSSTSISYYLMAKNPGKFTIPPAVFTINGKKILTKPISIQVVKSQSSNSSTPGGANSIILKTNIEPSNQIYLGQQALLSYDIYFQQSINLGNTLEAPDLSAFYYRGLGTSSYNYTKNYNGQVYNYATVEKGALFAQKVGKFRIGKLRKSIGIEKGTEQDSDFGFFSRKIYEPAIAESDETTIEVLPLPENAPEDFINGVGKYKAEIIVEKTQKGHELILILVGNGDERSLIVPKLKGNQEVEIYNGTKVKTDEDVPENLIIHTTYYRYPIVFKKEGDHTFECSFSYFDTEKKDYETIIIPVNYTVAPQIQENTFVGSHTVRENKIPAWVAGLLGASIAGILAIGGLLWYTKRNKNVENKELPSVIKEKQKVTIHRMQNSEDPFGEAKTRIFKQMQNQYGIETKDLNRSYIYEYLTKSGKTEEAQNIDFILELCEQAVYGGKNALEDKERLLEAMKKI
jgi:hypothetical protein